MTTEVVSATPEARLTLRIHSAPSNEYGEVIWEVTSGFGIIMYGKESDVLKELADTVRDLCAENLGFRPSVLEVHHPDSSTENLRDWKELRAGNYQIRLS